MVTKIGSLICPMNKWPAIDRAEYTHIFEENNQH